MVAMEILNNNYAVSNQIRVGKFEQLYSHQQTRTKDIPAERMITMERSLAMLVQSGKITALEASLATAQSQLATHVAQVDSLLCELSELRSGRDTLAATVATLESSSRSVSAAVVDTLAQIGVAPDALPTSQSEDQSDDALLTKYGTLSGAARTEFLRTHSTALHRAAAARDAARK